MAQAIDTSDYVYLVMTGNGWGSGKDKAEALRNCRAHMGTEHVKRCGYMVLRVHPDFRVSKVDGTVYTPAGHAAIEVEDRVIRRRKA